MMAQPKAHFSPEEYLALERQAEYKSEYLNGEIFAMAGASPNHVKIVTNIVGEFYGQLKGRPCTTFSTDMRLKVSPTGLYAYPDVIVVCGEPVYDGDTLLNPTLIIEVLSPSTEAYDRGQKFAHYRKLQSLNEYMIIAQDQPYIEHWVRQADNKWLLSESNNLHDIISLPSIECHLALAAVYDRVVFLDARER
jgi:Uma2 family endonuclease